MIPVTPLSAFVPAMCLRIAASRLRGIQILRADPPPIRPETKAALARHILTMENDARHYIRLAVLAGRARGKSHRPR